MRPEFIQWQSDLDGRARSLAETMKPAELRAAAREMRAQGMHGLADRNDSDALMIERDPRLLAVLEFEAAARAAGNGTALYFAAKYRRSIKSHMAGSAA